MNRAESISEKVATRIVMLSITYIQDLLYWIIVKLIVNYIVIGIDKKTFLLHEEEVYIVINKSAPVYSGKRREIKLKSLTQTYEKTSHTTWTLSIQIQIICLYNLYNKFKVHVVRLVFSVRDNHSDLRDISRSFLQSQFELNWWFNNKGPLRFKIFFTCSLIISLRLTFFPFLMIELFADPFSSGVVHNEVNYKTKSKK